MSKKQHSRDCRLASFDCRFRERGRSPNMQRRTSKEANGRATGAKKAKGEPGDVAPRVWRGPPEGGTPNQHGIQVVLTFEAALGVSQFLNTGQGAVPEGLPENSPAFQRRECPDKASSPEGTAELKVVPPSLRDGWDFAFKPGVETPGYCRLVPPGHKSSKLQARKN